MVYKNYKKWMGIKSGINNKNGHWRIGEGDVVWAAVGENVGVEIDGKNDRFSRPVIVLRKHSERCFTGIPLTSKRHKGSWYVSFVFQNRIQTAVLVQARLMDAARVYSRMGELSKKDYMLILKAYVTFIKGKNMP